jgi:hypothetical protein
VLLMLLCVERAWDEQATHEPHENTDVPSIHFLLSPSRQGDRAKR